MYLASPLLSLTESSQPSPSSQITYGADMTPEELCDLLSSTAVKDAERYQKQLKSLESEIKNLIAAIRSAQDVEGKRLQSAKLGDVFVELINLLEQYAPAWYTEEHHRTRRSKPWLTMVDTRVEVSGFVRPRRWG